ncbi:M48 family metalloprotease [Aliiglaciecola sp. M165]|uniref:beta-barrel assembly-enhancing protease n=1 Tax=Aliiglaciecola sp. M165 TaxID=2593649 RepID=UPI00117C7C84|nr:M48 family metalloprotease [Aliiglaciecola sp. M165]TRY30182.1 M48 family metallopeptidase [Aliiglaciecola sp. M165]
MIRFQSWVFDHTFVLKIEGRVSSLQERLVTRLVKTLINAAVKRFTAKIAVSLTASLYILFSAIASAQIAEGNQRNALPEIGVVASDTISINKEIQIGDILMRQLRGQAPLINDPLLDEYLQDLGNRLVAQSDNVKFPFKFFLLNSADINAFAFFGGHIGVHTGLIFNADNESELASVLAHEIAHVTQRHIARKIQAQQKASPLQLASLFGGLLLAIANPEAGIAAVSATNAAAQQSSINYTRSNEKEADRIGMQILAQAGYDPRASATFFQKLAEKYRLRSTPFAYLLTHPLPQSRIADARSRAQAFDVRQVPEKLSFHLAKARIIARYYGNPKDNITYFESILENQRYVFKQFAEYGLALTYFENEQFAESKAIIDRLRRSEPENLFYIDLATDIAIAQKQFASAVDMLEEQARRAPRNRVISLNLANVLIKKGDIDQATNVLKDYLLVNPDNMLALQLLSEAYGESRQLLEMHQSKAEVYALVAAYPRAIDELHTAYNFAGERRIEKQRIRARIDQFREAQDRLKAL